MNVLVVGIGGQGVMTAAEILAQVAVDAGFDAKKSEIAGMAQRGGVVTSHVRFGTRVLSPVIAPGTADLLVAFESAEALRWAEQLRPGGLAMVNTLRLPPPVVSGGLYAYPDDPVGSLHARGLRAHAVDAGAIARDLGDRKLVNTVMLGAIADHLPFPAELLEEKIIARFRIAPAGARGAQPPCLRGRAGGLRGGTGGAVKASGCRSGATDGMLDSMVVADACDSFIVRSKRIYRTAYMWIPLDHPHR